MANNNPLTFKDFFDFDDPTIKKAIEEMNELFTTWKEFKNEVIKPINIGFNQQSGELAASIKKVAESTTALSVTNEKSQQVLMDNLATMQRLRDENENLKKSQQGSKIVTDSLEESVNGLSQKLKEQLVAYRALKKGQDDLKMKTLASEIQVTRYEITELNNATKGTTSVFQAAKGSYAALDAETKKLIKDLQQMDNGLDANNMAAKVLKDQIGANTAQLKAFDAQIGHNFRNVGNYKSAFDGLGMSVQQILREAPSAAVSLNTFFLAISNNLPMFFDEVTKIKKVQQEALVVAKAAAVVAKEQAVAQALATGATEAAAAAEGALAAETVIANAAAVAGPGLWARLSASLFSLNTLLTVGVLALTLFGGKIVDWIGKLFKGNKAVDDFKNNLANLNEVMKDADKDAGSQIASLDALYHSATNANLPMVDRLKYVKELKSEFPTFFAGLKEEDILNGKTKKSYDELVRSILNTAKAKAALTKLGDIASQQLDLDFQADKVNVAVDNEKYFAKNSTQNIGLGQTVTYTAEQQRAAAEVRRKKALDDINDKKAALQRQADFLVKFAGGEKAIADSIVTGKAKDTTEKDAKKAEADARKAERALEQAVKRADELEKASAKFQVAQREAVFAKSAKNSEDEISFEQDKLKILEKSFNTRSKLYAKDSKQYQDIQAEKLEAETKAEEKILQIRDKAIVQRTNNALKEAEAVYDISNKGWVAQEAFEAKRKDILDKGYDERLALYKKDSDEYNKILADKTAADASYTEKSIQLAKARLEAETGALDSGKDLSNATYTGTVRMNVAKGSITKDAGEKALHISRVSDLQEEIDKKQDQLNHATKGDKDYYDYLKELNKLKKDLVNENADYEISAAEKVQERKKELQQKIFDLAVETGGQLFDLGKSFSDANLSQLEADKQKELDLAGNNAAAKAKIEEDYHKKIAALKRKQAIMDKLQSIFDIAISTAVAVAKSVKDSPLTFGMPFSGFAIAQGIVQTALVLAKPIPNYYKGRGKGKDEWANINEQGPELIEDGNSFRFANKGKEGATFLKANERVRTAKETKEIMSDIFLSKDVDAFINSLNSGKKDVTKYSENKEQKIIDAIIKSKLSETSLGRIFETAVSKMQGNIFAVDERGWRQFQKTVNGKIERLNERNKLMGDG